VRISWDQGGVLQPERIELMKYQIKVQGSVDPSWSDWFNGMEVSLETERDAGCVTTFTGAVADQASLRGILNHLWDLNLTLLSVSQIEPEGCHV
jgi:hypothetical protein